MNESQDETQLKALIRRGLDAGLVAVSPRVDGRLRAVRRTALARAAGDRGLRPWMRPAFGMGLAALVAVMATVAFVDWRSEPEMLATNGTPAVGSETAAGWDAQTEALLLAEQEAFLEWFDQLELAPGDLPDGSGDAGARLEGRATAHG